jgi:hypothetical protein
MSNNTAYGEGALAKITSPGSDNSAFGAYALYTNTDGSYNTAVGTNALYYNTDGDHNTSFGAGALVNNISSNLNTAVGSSCLEGPPNVGPGNENVGVGAQALFRNTGSGNTSVGSYSLSSDISSNTVIGDENVAIGYYSGSSQSTYNYNTLLGAYTDISNATIQYATAIGYNAIANASNSIMLGGLNNNNQYPNVFIPGSLNVSGTATANSFTSTSDYRVKENIHDIGESYNVDNLRPVSYTHKLTKKQDIGLIAHELQEVYPNLVEGEKDGEEHQSVNYIGLIGILIKEIKELKTRTKHMEEKLNV